MYRSLPLFSERLPIPCSFIATPIPALGLLYGLSMPPVFVPEPPFAASDQLANYPNPFTTSTTIVLSQSMQQASRISVVDMLGREIAVLQSGETASGAQELVWHPDAGEPAGMYWIVARGAGGEMSKPVLLMR